MYDLRSVHLPSHYPQLRTAGGSDLALEDRLDRLLLCYNSIGFPENSELMWRTMNSPRLTIRFFKISQYFLLGYCHFSGRCALSILIK